MLAGALATLSAVLGFAGSYTHAPHAAHMSVRPTTDYGHRPLRANVACAAADTRSETELQALSLPGSPTPELGPREVAQAICRGLQHVDLPTESKGVERIFRFATYECRAALTARRGSSAGNGGEADCAASLERFLGMYEEASMQALFPLVRCPSFTIGDPTLIAATQTRGAIATLVVAIGGGEEYRYRSGFAKGEAADASPYAAAAQSGEELVRFTLQQERRPPLQGCWLVSEVLPARLHDMENRFTWI